MNARYIIGAIVAVTLGVPVGAAYSQNAEDVGLEEIIVTARKREESIQDVPIAISVFSATDIDEGGLASLEDISTLASGLYFQNQALAKPGRYDTQLRFRGLNNSQFSPTFDTGALFIDGSFVLNGGTSLSLMDIERVEVIKGPQAAYFGRGTFGGAVNFITKNPSMDGFGGAVSLTASHRDLLDLNTFIEGPLIADKLSGSLGVRFYDKKGHYRATDGGVLGNEETTTINGKLFLQATDNFTVGLRIAYSEDDDGAPAGAFIAGTYNDTCSGRTITTGTGERVNPNTYVCGQVPDINSAIPSPGGASIINANTILPDSVVDFATGGSIPNGGPFVGTVGMKRETLRASLQAALDVNDYTIDMNVSLNDQALNFIRDFDLTGLPNAFSQDPQGLEDSSVELRLTSPQDGGFRWMVGFNYYEQDFTFANTGGNFNYACFEDPDPAVLCVPNFALNFGQNSSFGQSDHSEVTGFFGAMDYDITDELTLTVEGRFQNDILTKGGTATAAGLDSGAVDIETDEFLPRVILRWQPSDTTTVFGSWSVGFIPGDVNVQFLNADDRERPQYVAAIPNVGVSTGQEELDSFEFGVKQTLFDGSGYINFAYFNQSWTGIKGRSSIPVNETCDATGPNALGVTGCEYAGVTAGDPKMVDDPSNPGTMVPFLNVRTVLTEGDADLSGFELDFGGQLNDYLSVDASVAYVDSEYTQYLFNFVERFAGFSEMRGNSTPRTPEWSGSLSSTFTWPLNDGKNLYVRGDVTFMGEVFTDETNLAYLDSYFLTNLRAGLDTDTYRIELFVKNLFDEDAWATGARFSDTALPVRFSPSNIFVFQGFNVTPQNRIEFGLRATYRFGSR